MRSPSGFAWSRGTGTSWSVTTRPGMRWVVAMSEAQRLAVDGDEDAFADPRGVDRRPQVCARERAVVEGLEVDGDDRRSRRRLRRLDHVVGVHDDRAARLEQRAAGV